MESQKYLSTDMKEVKRAQTCPKTREYYSILERNKIINLITITISIFILIFKTFQLLVDFVKIAKPTENYVTWKNDKKQNCLSQAERSSIHEKGECRNCQQLPCVVVPDFKQSSFKFADNTRDIRTQKLSRIPIPHKTSYRAPSSQISIIRSSICSDQCFPTARVPLSQEPKDLNTSTNITKSRQLSKNTKTICKQKPSQIPILVHSKRGDNVQRTNSTKNSNSCSSRPTLTDDVYGIKSFPFFATGSSVKACLPKQKYRSSQHHTTKTTECRPIQIGSQSQVSKFNNQKQKSQLSLIQSFENHPLHHTEYSATTNQVEAVLINSIPLLAKTKVNDTSSKGVKEFKVQAVKVTTPCAVNSTGNHKQKTSRIPILISSKRAENVHKTRPNGQKTFTYAPITNPTCQSKPNFCVITVDDVHGPKSKNSTLSTASSMKTTLHHNKVSYCLTKNDSLDTKGKGSAPTNNEYNNKRNQVIPDQSASSHQLLKIEIEIYHIVIQI